MMLLEPHGATTKISLQHGVVRRLRDFGHMMLPRLRANEQKEGMVSLWSRVGIDQLGRCVGWFSAGLGRTRRLC